MKNKKNLPALPECPDDSDATLQLLLEVAARDETFLPQRVQCAFADAGFTVRRCEREETHPTVWTIWLTRISMDLSKNNQVAGKQIRRALAEHGLKIGPGEFTVLEQRDNKLRCAFLLGTPPPPPDF